MTDQERQRLAKQCEKLKAADDDMDEALRQYQELMSLASYQAARARHEIATLLAASKTDTDIPDPYMVLSDIARQRIAKEAAAASETEPKEPTYAQCPSCAHCFEIGEDGRAKCTCKEPAAYSSTCPLCGKVLSATTRRPPMPDELKQLAEACWGFFRHSYVGPYDRNGYCEFCHMHKGRPHTADCRWRRIAELTRATHRYLQQQERIDATEIKEPADA